MSTARPESYRIVYRSDGKGRLGAECSRGRLRSPLLNATEGGCGPLLWTLLGLGRTADGHARRRRPCAHLTSWISESRIRSRRMSTSYAPAAMAFRIASTFRGGTNRTIRRTPTPLRAGRGDPSPRGCVCRVTAILANRPLPPDSAPRSERARSIAFYRRPDAQSCIEMVRVWPTAQILPWGCCAVRSTLRSGKVRRSRAIAQGEA